VHKAIEKGRNSIIFASIVAYLFGLSLFLNIKEGSN
jgi:hypothetical protein